jgi:hypothetical protein
LDANRCDLSSNEVNLGWMDRDRPRKGGRAMMEIDEMFHELNAAVKMYYEEKRNSLSKEADFGIYYTWQERESQLYAMLKATREFIQWGESINE